MNIILKTCLALVIIGAINWGLVGLFDFNLVEYLFGDGSLLTRIVYVLVAVSGLVDIAIFTKNLDRQLSINIINYIFKNTLSFWVFFLS